MLKPQELQTIEDFMRMIEELDDETRREAIRETNERLEKLDSLRFARSIPPVIQKPIAKNPKPDISDLFCPHCGSHEIAKNGSVRSIPRLVCQDCNRSLGGKPWQCHV